MFHDLLYAVRALGRSPRFTAMTTVTLGLGIGAVAALFAVVDAVMLQPVVSEQHRLLRIWGHDEVRGFDRVMFSYDEIRAWRDASRRLENVAAIQYADASSVALAIDGRSIAVEVTPVSAGFFEVVHDGPPLHGRWSAAVDEAPGADLVAVVSERFWRRLGGDPLLVGRRLARAGGGPPVLVIGVAPAALDYPIGTDLWMPLAGFYSSVSTPRFDIEAPNFRQFHAIARMAPGVSIEQVQAELDVLHQQWLADAPAIERTSRIVVEPLLDALLGDGRQVLLFLSAAGGLVFVVAGVNVAALLLMRASTRRREQAVRVALGAGRARLTREALAEGLLLGSASAAVGIVIAVAALAVLRWVGPEEIPRIERAAIDLRVLLVGAGAALAWVLTFGTSPAWGRPLAIQGGLANLSVRGPRRSSALRVFTVAQIAAGVVVAVAAGLLVRSFVQLHGIDRGYDAGNLAVVRLLLPDARYPTPRARVALWETLVSRVSAVPAVRSAAPVHIGPGTGSTGLSAGLIFEGQTPEEARSNPWATWEPVLPSYFETLGIPIVRGRAFNPADRADTAPVAIVSEAMANRYWPGQDPVGKRLQFIREFAPATVVGVAGDTRYRELTRGWLTVYFPAPQFFFFGPGSLVVRTTGDPDAVVPAIRQIVQDQDAEIAVMDVSTMEALAARELARPRTALSVATLFALLAVVLAAVGVYGVLSYEVAERRRELAVRSALGASPGEMFRAVVRRSLWLAAAGTAMGLAASAAASGALRSLLFDVSPGDPGAFVAGGGLLLAIVVLASYPVARRAARTDPVSVLRTD